jgi:glycerophosphoryl diester phosphodiesterase
MKNFINKKSTWILLIIFLIWLNNTSMFLPEEKPYFLAHRALGQTHGLEGVKWDTNTAAMIDPPEHGFIENTIPAITRAIELGAEVVEIDIRLTGDEELALFHDFTLEYRSDGEGMVADQTMEYLKTLDVGYGYTADGGKTYPLRGKGLGLMVTLNEVLSQFPEQKFLVHIKDGDEAMADALLEYLSEEKMPQRLSFYGNDIALGRIRELYPELPILSMKRMMSALIWYELIGWTGWVPPASRNIQYHIPIQMGPFLWGWPARFVKRMENAGSNVILVDRENGWSKGFDRAEDIDRIPMKYSGGIWTDRIDRVHRLR